MKKTTYSLLLLALTACTAKESYAPDYADDIRITSRQEALNLLPEEAKLKFEVWRDNLVKDCSVGSVFDTRPQETSENTYSYASGVDLRMFFQKTGNSLFLKPKTADLPKENAEEWDLTEFAIFGAPHLSPVKRDNSSYLPIVKEGRNARLLVETKMENGICTVLVGKYKLDSYLLAENIPLLAHSSQTKREKIAKSIPIEASPIRTSRGYMKFETWAISGAGQATLSPSPQYFRRPDEEPINEENRVVFSGADQLARDFIYRELGNIDRSKVDRYFSLNGLGGHPVSIEFVGRPTEIPFGLHGSDFIGSERHFKDLKSKKTHELKTLWKIKPALFKQQDPSNPDQNIGNENVDKNYWSFEIASKFNGNIEEGGVAEVTGFVMKLNLPAPPADYASQCFTKRAFYEKLFADQSNSNLMAPIGWFEASGPCSVHSQDLLADILASPEAFNEFKSVLKVVRPSREYNYRGWDLQFKEIIKKYMNGDIDKNIGDLDAENRVPLFVKSRQNYEALKAQMTANADLTRRFKEGLEDFLELGNSAVLVNFDLNQLDILAKIRPAADKTTGLLERNFAGYIRGLTNHFATPPTDPNTKKPDWENLKNQVAKLDKMAALPDDTSSKLAQVEAIALRLKMDQWVFGNVRNFLNLPNDRIAAETVTLWTENLVALESFYRDESVRLAGASIPSQNNYWRLDFETRYMNMGWNPLSLRYMQKFSEIVEYVNECSQHKDVISRLWCTNASNISSGVNGVLFPETRDRLWELSNELNFVLPRLPADEIRTQVARQFFAPMFQNCRPDNFRLKVKNLMSFLIRYRKNPVEEKARPDFQARLNEALAGCY